MPRSAEWLRRLVGTHPQGASHSMDHPHVHQLAFRIRGHALRRIAL